MESRVRGDNYPIEAVLKVNGLPIDITGATVAFSYKMHKGTTNSIAGVITNASTGSVVFNPTITDFQEVGVFEFDIQVVNQGIKTTYAVGVLNITNDVNKD